MRTLAVGRTYPPATCSRPGYFRIPVCRHGSRYDLPLGFVGTTGCRWARQGGCTVCDYGGFDGEVPSLLLVDQANQLLDEWGPENEVSLNALGSFFDDDEMPVDARMGILRAISSHPPIDLLSVETRPDTVTRAKIQAAVDLLGPSITLEVGLGLESADDFVRNVCVNKGLPLTQFARAVEDIVEAGAQVCAHVLLKPPFLTEAEAVADAVSSIDYAFTVGVRRTVLMVCNIKAATLTHWLWQRGAYRPPWLWSALEVVRRISAPARRKLLIYGFKCGLPLLETGHNCDLCTDTVLRQIEGFRATQDPAVVEDALQIECRCKADWHKDMEYRDNTPLRERVERFCSTFESGGDL